MPMRMFMRAALFLSYSNVVIAGVLGDPFKRFVCEDEKHMEEINLVLA